MIGKTSWFWGQLLAWYNFEMCFRKKAQRAVSATFQILALPILAESPPNFGTLVDLVTKSAQCQKNASNSKPAWRDKLQGQWRRWENKLTTTFFLNGNLASSWTFTLFIWLFGCSVKTTALLNYIGSTDMKSIIMWKLCHPLGKLSFTF